jgi:dipeptidyl-peptidase-4
MKKSITIFLTWFTCISVSSQQNITLEGIWKKYEYSAKGISGWRSMNDGLHYTIQKENKIIRYDYKTGSAQQEWQFSYQYQPLSFDAYTFSNDENKILLSTASESIYRYSTLDKNFIYDVASGNVVELDPAGKQKYACFSPNASHVAYVKDNNIFIKDLSTESIQQITNDGKNNSVINGGSDWVYEEEFALIRAFEWSPDGKSIVYLKFDEEDVPMFEMAMYEGRLYPKDYEFKYPKVGEKNASVSLHMYDLNTGNTKKIALGNYEYIPRIGWTKNGDAYAITLNRLQNHLQFFLIKQQSGDSKQLFEEKSDTYIEIKDQFQMLDDKKRMLWTSEKTGFNHIYLVDLNTGKMSPVTTGQWEVTEVFGADDKSNLIYFESTEVSPMERHVYSISMDGKKKNKLTNTKGTHRVQFSKGFKYMFDNFSSAGLPSTYTLYDQTGKNIRVLENNQVLTDKLNAMNLKKPEFFSFKNTTGTELNGYMIKPREFNPDVNYPVLMFVYGGPGSQQVLDQWGGANYVWFQHLAQQGYIVVCVDNRGTGGRGKSFRDCTYKQLGKLETEDQIDAAKYLGSLPFIDKNRIGIFGWSYGGYMSSLCITKGADIFKSAIAVAPVTNWKFYDSIYTERYMGTKESNPDGYDQNAPVTYAERLKGNYLLVHGTADDNVHWQNTAEMTTALIKAGKNFDQFIYPDKNHGIYGGNTRYHLYSMMTQFILKKL